MHTTIHLSGPYAAVAALLASPLPMPPSAPLRVALAAQIEHLIDVLDAYDAVTEDLEDTGDDEPSLGHYTGSANQIDLELDEAENEPDLGSLDAQTDQRMWSSGSADDGELDESDHEHSGGGAASGDDDPTFGHLLPPSAFVGSAVRP